MSISIGAPIRLQDGRAESTLRWVNVAGKEIFLLRQTGHYEDICYDHGRLLSRPTEEGVFPEILDTIRTATDVSSDFMDTVTEAIYRRMSDEVFEACSDEFRAGAMALGDGIFDAIDDPGFSAQDVRDAVVAIDVGNLAEGLARRMEKPLATEVQGTIGYIIRAVRRYRRGRSRVGISREVMAQRERIGASVQKLRHPRRRVGFGCTAVGAAPELCADGRGLHARTFDGAFFAWNTCPGLFLIDERVTNPSWHRYVAVGTAGLTYSGGISGMNDAGIAASIHQMSTVQYDTGRPGRGYDIAPFMQQRILREAGSVDEAEEILLGARHFASWTIVVSDAKTGEAARFELNGGRQAVDRTDLPKGFSQSNHFLSAALAEQNHFFEDAHFTPTFGKWLESRARLVTVEEALSEHRDRGTLGTDAAIDILSSHDDGELKGAPRSFGRTICKAYGLMASVARADPDRSAPKDEIWMSVGNRAPGPHSDFAGFSIDWEALDVSPAGDRAVRTPATASAEFMDSLSDYVAAFSALSRPVDDQGDYLGRDPTEQELGEALQRAIYLIDRATRRAEDAGEIDVPFRYARARLCHQAGEYDRAAADWDFLRSIFDLHGVPLHAWEKTLILILSAATALARGQTTDAAGLLADAEMRLAKIRKDRFPDPARPHADLRTWEKVIAALREDGAGADLPEFDFVTVE